MKDDKRIKDLGEFGLIDRIDQGLVCRDPDVIVGVGDDTAALRVSGERLLLATCDVQIEGEHFLRGRAVPYLLGRKSMAINLETPSGNQSNTRSGPGRPRPGDRPRCRKPFGTRRAVRRTRGCLHQY